MVVKNEVYVRSHTDFDRRVGKVLAESLVVRRVGRKIVVDVALPLS